MCKLVSPGISLATCHPEVKVSRGRQLGITADTLRTPAEHYVIGISQRIVLCHNSQAHCEQIAGNWVAAEDLASGTCPGTLPQVYPVMNLTKIKEL